MTRDDTAGRWVSVQTAAAMVELSRDTLHRAIRAETLPAVRASTAGYRIRVADLDEWMETHASAH
ncbi:MAG TPA: helix-turn-helix domain-containing protein [Jiangellaceae bacterium]|nr:helix-turn-helix domain-containing protein [Jiangellaceae bacterium]